MLTLTIKPATPPAPTVQSNHDWLEYARAKEASAFPSRKAHRVCRRCGVVCRSDTEFAPCDPGTTPTKAKPC